MGHILPLDHILPKYRDNKSHLVLSWTQFYAANAFCVQ